MTNSSFSISTSEQGMQCLKVLKSSGIVAWEGIKQISNFDQSVIDPLLFDCRSEVLSEDRL